MTVPAWCVYSENYPGVVGNTRTGRCWDWYMFLLLVYLIIYHLSVHVTTNSTIYSPVHTTSYLFIYLQLSCIGHPFTFLLSSHHTPILLPTTLKSTFTQDWCTSKTLPVIHTKSKQSRETFYDVDFNYNILVSRQRKLEAGQLQNWGPRFLMSFALHPLPLHFVLSPHYRAKTVVVGLDGLFLHSSVHRQKTAVCPSWSTFIREAALSHLQLYPDTLSLQPKWNAHHTWPEDSNYQV